MKIKMFFLTTAFITQSTYASELPGHSSKRFS